MSTAIVTTSSHALTVTTVAPLERVFIKSEVNPVTLKQRIREASASVADVGVYLRKFGASLKAQDLRVAEYALARARYRENLDVTLRQLSLLAEQSVEQIANHMRMIGMSARSVFSSNDATRIMCRVMD